MSYCSHCGAKIDAGAKFCASCGKNVVESVSEATPQVSEKPSTPPPNPPEKKKSKFKTGCLGIIAALIVLALVGSCMGDSDSKNDTAGKKTTTATTQKKAPEYNYICDVNGIGKVKGAYSSNVGVAIARIQEMPTIDTRFSSARAQGVFKVLYIVATNNQKDEVTLDANSYKLIDDQGREYSHSIEGGTQLQMSDRPTLFLKNINPGITTGGYVAYDVPKGAKIVKLQFRGGFSGSKSELPFQVMLAQ